MGRKFKLALLLPMAFQTAACGNKGAISFHTGDFTFETYYEDGYFMRDSKEVSQEIALVSQAMALSTINFDENYANRDSFLKELWNAEGFKDVFVNDDFLQKPGTDTVGYGIANKFVEVGDTAFTLVSLVVRGGDCKGEWANSFVLDTEGNAKGFEESSDVVYEGLFEYLKKIDVKGHVKLWISGYSRGGTIANLLAGKILDLTEGGTYHSETYDFSDHDIYAYCFEAPMAAGITPEIAKGELYRGIHNYLLYDDPVTLLLPAKWGFARYGTDHYYPHRLTDINFQDTERRKIVSLYHFTPGADQFASYTLDDWRFFDVGEKTAEEHNLPIETLFPSIGRFARIVIDEFVERSVNTRTSYMMLEDGVHDLVAAINGLYPDVDGLGLKSVLELFFENDLLKILYLDIEEDEPFDFASDAKLLFLQLFGANEKNFETLEGIYEEINLFLYSFALTFRNRKDVLTQFFFRDNLNTLLVAHKPEISYSYLRACDPRILGEEACKLNDGNYRTLHVKKPTSLKLYEDSLNKEIFSYANGEMKSQYVSCERLADDSIDIHLPLNGTYRYEGNFESMSLGMIDPIHGETLLTSSLPSKSTL